MKDGLSRSISISLAGHGIVACLIFLRAIFVPQENIQVRSAIRVDVVDLPEKQSETMPQTPPKRAAPEPVKPVAESKPEQAHKPTPVDAPKVPATGRKPVDLKAKEKQALARLNALSAVDKLKQELAREKAAAKANSTVVKGNILSEGNSPTGLSKIDYNRYVEELKAKVLSQWNLPQWLSEAGYKASVQVLIDERGFVIKKVIRRSSGNDVFDTKAIEAIDASSPLPAPPERLRGLLSTNGVTFNFPE